MEDVVLGHVTDHGPVEVELLIEAVAIDEDLSLLCAVDAAERLHQRALPGAAGPHEGDELPRIDGKGDVVKDALAPLPPSYLPDQMDAVEADAALGDILL